MEKTARAWLATIKTTMQHAWKASINKWIVKNIYAVESGTKPRKLQLGLEYFVPNQLLLISCEYRRPPSYVKDIINYIFYQF